MKKIVLINGSKRKKNTALLLNQIETKLKENYETELIHLGNYNINFCSGCEYCISHDKCTLKDDCKILLDKLEEADGIVIGTPVYLRNISGLLKLLIDRTCSWYHRSPIIGKPILTVTTTAYSGTKASTRYLKEVYMQWGAIHSGDISRKTMTLKNEVNDRELAKFMKILNQPLYDYEPSLRQIFEFNTQKVLARQIIPRDNQYWKAKGWLDSDYYYNCKINVIKKLLGLSYYKLLCTVIPSRI